MYKRLGFAIFATLTAAPLVLAQVHGRPSPRTPSEICSLSFTGIPSKEPGGTAECSKFAQDHPEDYAWRLFTYMNRQADPNKIGEPDLTKTAWKDYVDDTPVVWETWALASGSDPTDPCSDQSEVFTQPARQPAPWGGGDEKKSHATHNKVLTEGLTRAIAFTSSTPVSSVSSASNFIARSATPLVTVPFAHVRISGGGDQEVRINRSAYNTIRGDSKHQGFYSQEKIHDAVMAVTGTNGTHEASFVTFDAAAKEVKASWLHLTQCDKPNDQSAECLAQKKRYHWRTITYTNRSDEVWGLAAMHIITRDLTNWFWADFIHIDCEKNKAPCRPLDIPSHPKASSTHPYPGHDDGKWNNYYLRGTQIDFHEHDGTDSHLLNPVIDHGATTTSSCITCHAFASGSADPFASAAPIANPGQFDLSGTPPECVFHRNCDATMSPNPQNTIHNRKFIQADFVWSIILRAQRESPDECQASR